MNRQRSKSKIYEILAEAIYCESQADLEKTLLSKKINFADENLPKCKSWIVVPTLNHVVIVGLISLPEEISNDDVFGYDITVYNKDSQMIVREKTTREVNAKDDDGVPEERLLSIIKYTEHLDRVGKPRKGLSVSIYSSDKGEDGLTVLPAGVTTAILCGDGIPELFEESLDCPALFLDMSTPESVCARPAWVKRGSWTMCGGRFIATSDSRFGQAVERLLGTSFYGAISLHDRVEN